MGDPSSTTLEMLRDLVQAKKSGTLSVATEIGAAEIRLASGAIEDAAYARAEGEKALFRVLAHPAGRPSFVEGPPSGMPRIRATSEALLAAATATIADLRRLRDLFPEASTRPLLVAEGTSGRPDLSDGARAVLPHLRAPILLDDLLDLAPGTDVETLVALEELDRAGRLRRLASTVDAVPLASHEQRERLRTMAMLGLRRGFGEHVRIAFAGTPSRLALVSHATLCIAGAERPLGGHPPVPMPHTIASIRLADDIVLDLVSLPLVPAYSPLWLMALAGTSVVVRLDEAGGSLLDEACEAAGTKVVDASMLVGPYDEANVAEVAVLIRASLEA